MPVNNETFNSELFKMLKTRGYKPLPLDVTGKVSKFPEEADVFKFEFTKDGKSYGTGHIVIDDRLTLYYDDDMKDSPVTKGEDFGDNFDDFRKQLKYWAKSRQLGFDLKNVDHLGPDMKKREYIKMKEELKEGYYPIGKKASYSDSVPNVKIIIQHTRQIEEGEQRYRNVAKIFLENTEGERFVAPTKRPGIAKVYARHVAEGGTPYDERGKHITSLVEEYTKMAGFTRAVKNMQFNESAQKLVQEGLNHYKNLRETLSRMISTRGYNKYFESWTPVLTEESDESVNEFFVQETIDPRIESAMPILNRLSRNITEMAEVSELEEWSKEVTESYLADETELEETVGVFDYNPRSQGGTRKELLAKLARSKSPEDAEAARKAGATQDELRRAMNSNSALGNAFSDLDDAAAGLKGLGITEEAEQLDENWVSLNVSHGEGYKSIKDLEEELKAAGISFRKKRSPYENNVAFEVPKKYENKAKKILWHLGEEAEQLNEMKEKVEQALKKWREQEDALNRHVWEVFGGWGYPPPRKDPKYNQFQQLDKLSDELKSKISKAEAYLQARKQDDKVNKANLDLLNLGLKVPGKQYTKLDKPVGPSGRYTIKKGHRGKPDERLDDIERGMPTEYKPGEPVFTNRPLKPPSKKPKRPDVADQLISEVDLDEGFTSSEEIADEIEKSMGGPGRLTSDDVYAAIEDFRDNMDNPHKLDVEEVAQIIMDRFRRDGIMIPDISEDLDANQKRAGQLGPTEKVGPEGAVGKLVGTSESIDRIRKLAGLN